MGLCGDGSVIGPIIFERKLNGAAYLQMLNEEVKNSNSPGDYVVGLSAMEWYRSSSIVVDANVKLPK